MNKKGVIHRSCGVGCVRMRLCIFACLIIFWHTVSLACRSFCASIKQYPIPKMESFLCILAVPLSLHIDIYLFFFFPLAGSPSHSLANLQGDRTEKVGVVDSEYVVHQGIQTLGGSSADKVGTFLCCVLSYIAICYCHVAHVNARVGQPSTNFNLRGLDFCLLDFIPSFFLHSIPCCTPWHYPTASAEAPE